MPLSKQRTHYTRRKRPTAPKETLHRNKLHVKKGDLVKVLSGDDKGKTGVVKQALPAKGQVIVEGINKRWKHLRRTQENPQGGRIEREFPIHACKVKKVEE